MEDHLGAALIQPGDSVIIRMSGFVAFYLAEQAGWNREYIRPMHYRYGSVWGFLFAHSHKRKYVAEHKKKGEYL